MSGSTACSGGDCFTANRLPYTRSIGRTGTQEHAGSVGCAIEGTMAELAHLDQSACVRSQQQSIFLISQGYQHAKSDTLGAACLVFVFEGAACMHT